MGWVLLFIALVCALAVRHTTTSAQRNSYIAAAVVLGIFGVVLVHGVGHSTESVAPADTPLPLAFRTPEPISDAIDAPEDAKSTPAPTAKPTPQQHAGAARASQGVSFVKALSDRAEDQYESARAIVGDTPKTQLEASEMVNGSGPAGQFYQRDRELQSDIKCKSIDSAGAMLACLDLAEAEEFEYRAAFAALGSCNEHDARLNLNVARAFLDEVQRDLAGTNVDGWNAPDITNEVTGASDCNE